MGRCEELGAYRKKCTGLLNPLRSERELFSSPESACLFGKGSCFLRHSPFTRALPVIQSVLRFVRGGWTGFSLGTRAYRRDSMGILFYTVGRRPSWPHTVLFCIDGG